ncbi:MAG: DUF1249 domain-containing protein [Betaproteobacteria bacterium]|nr:DUF1249 domain-containing protein [Betaproteobacteria bacterium]
MATENHSRDIHARIFHKLLEVVPDLFAIEEHGSSVIEGYMDLDLDVLGRASSRIVIALSHYYRHPSGDMIPDPDMVIAVYPGQEQAEALSYQDLYSYREVYSHDMGRVDWKAKRSLNEFLNSWLRNLIAQGHYIGQSIRGDR